MTDPLHLPSLSIRSFRGVDELRIPKLGRVTLLAGKNGVGKTTVLDAVRVYAARGTYTALHEVLTDRQEHTEFDDEDGDTTLGLDSTALFHGRNPTQNSVIAIGPDSDAESLRIVATKLSEEQAFRLGRLAPALASAPMPSLKVVYGEHEHVLWGILPMSRFSLGRGRRLLDEEDPPPQLTCEYIGPEVLSASDMSRFWDNVALTDDERLAVDAVNLSIGSKVRGITIIGDGESRARRSVRRAIVRLKTQQRPVPLRSLGGGAVRLFGVALALANSRGGFLLIDEAENGIHHTLQYDLWKMVLHTAHANDVQVVATTHSWDCVSGFARAASEFEHGEGILVRLDRDDRRLRAVDYSKEALQVAAEQGIEVR